MNAEKIKELKVDLKQVRREMRESGIKRSSFMNAGHSRESNRYNCECFRLESEIRRLEAQDSSHSNADVLARGESATSIQSQTQ